MKNITMFRLFTAFIITLIAMPVLAQRANFDSERMDRDLRIMERIYTDLQRQAAGVMGTTNVKAVTGSYFSGYGIIFNVNETFSSNFFFGSTVSNSYSSYSVTGLGTNTTNARYSSDSLRSQNNAVTVAHGNRLKAENATREIQTDSLSILAYERNKDIIRDFFANYIDAIGQLDDDDRVSVVISNRGNPIVYTTISQNSRLVSSSFNPLRAEVQIKDVVAYRTGAINESTFMDRIVFSELDSQASNHKELQVMQGIFESALRVNQQSDYKLSRDVQGFILTNFGAMFNLEVSVPITKIRIRGQMLPPVDSDGNIEILLLDSTKVIMPRPNSYSITPTTRTNTTGYAVDSLTTATFERSTFSYIDALNTFIDQTSELVLDYGRTLRSLKPNELVLVSINQQSTQDDLPKRVEIQIDMQTLRDLDRGSISRDQAKQKMIVRKFNS
jgi:hypothetical protein